MRNRRPLAVVVSAALLALGVSVPAPATTWMGTISGFSASPATITAASSGSMLDLTFSAPLAGYSASVYDPSGHRVGLCTGSDYMHCSVYVTVPLNASDTYTGYVALDSPSDGAPSQDVRASANVAVTNVGWTGTISGFSASGTFVAANQPVALDVKLTAPLSGYRASVYDESGHLVKVCSGSSDTHCPATVSLAAGELKVLTAYVALDSPSVSPPAQDVRALGGPVVVAAMDPTDALVAPPVAALEQQLLSQANAEEACLLLGESARTNALESTVPDATLVCNASGLPAALKFIAATAGAAGTAYAIASLWEATNHPTDPAAAHPDCDQVNSVGDCVDPGGPGTLTLTDVSPDQEEPQPDPAGAGIPPLSNCMDDQTRQPLRDSMPEQYHHMATKYGTWGERFQLLLDENGYNLTVADPTLSWNVYLMPHRGPHPGEYHQWVYENMELAAETAGYGNAVEFEALFDRWVVQRVLNDPTIVRVAYWKCHR